MRVRRSLIIPAILALDIAVSLLTGSAMSTAAGHQATAHVQAAAAPTAFRTYYHA
jgi:hypothetical protein